MKNPQDSNIPFCRLKKKIKIKKKGKKKTNMKLKMKTRVEKEFFYFRQSSAPKNLPQELCFSASYKLCMGAISLKHVTLHSAIQIAQNVEAEN